MAMKTNYMMKRNNRFYFRMRIPTNLRYLFDDRKEIRRPLGTGNPRLVSGQKRPVLARALLLECNNILIFRPCLHTMSAIHSRCSSIYQFLSFLRHTSPWGAPHGQTCKHWRAVISALNVQIKPGYVQRLMTRHKDGSTVGWQTVGPAKKPIPPLEMPRRQYFFLHQYQTIPASMWSISNAIIPPGAAPVRLAETAPVLACYFASGMVFYLLLTPHTLLQCRANKSPLDCPEHW